MLEDLAEGEGDLAGLPGEPPPEGLLKRSLRWRTQSVGSKGGGLAGTERALDSSRQLRLPAWPQAGPRPATWHARTLPTPMHLVAFVCVRCRSGEDAPASCLPCSGDACTANVSACSAHD